ncbi:beta-ketoacyl synthase N-terminal-like domain-containing protein [Streptomyces sp. RerS4]|uniref:beta-ketoacyl synthase N-terminal-like domain-containing protein n=1 Tax=Streptomyces sp. RerS4 TaxID=2942449 RepID=UPI00201C02F1|nr:beta-ketoacyl synthase N-terminal-like domain-containing protein [Streptomyces sp. RerS4]UQX05393.1 hypothetical protein M4D82_33470 [Streptomyces sp. RerS4]
MTRDRSHDIAVTGMAARLPGSGDFPVRWRAPHTDGPRHRLMLEAVRRALGDTGPEPYSEAASTGVYAAGATGPGHAARRIAHRLGLTGPVRDFPASQGSALVTVRAAVEALRAGECDLCVVVAGHGVGGPEAAGQGPSAAGAACLVLRRLDELPAGAPRPYGVILDAAVASGPERGAGRPGADTAGLTPLVDALLLLRAPTGSRGPRGSGTPAPMSCWPPRRDRPPTGRTARPGRRPGPQAACRRRRPAYGSCRRPGSTTVAGYGSSWSVPGASCCACRAG